MSKLLSLQSEEVVGERKNAMCISPGARYVVDGQAMELFVEDSSDPICRLAPP